MVQYWCNIVIHLFVLHARNESFPWRGFPSNLKEKAVSIHGRSSKFFINKGKATAIIFLYLFLGPLLVTPLFLSNFIQTIIMFFNIVGQGFTLGYCGREIAQLLFTCFSLFSILDKEKIATNSFSPGNHRKFEIICPIL